MSARFWIIGGLAAFLIWAVGGAIQKYGLLNVVVFTGIGITGIGLMILAMVVLSSKVTHG